MEIVRQSLATAQDIAARPIRTATSKTAQRAYLVTTLLAFLTCVLLGLSSFGFIVFYNLYIPTVGIERPLYLQFGNGHPFARTDLGNSLTSNQPYDITVSLVLPRSASNIAAGNFMLDVSLLPPNSSQVQDRTSLLHQVFDLSGPSIARSRRPAILTHTPTVVEFAQTLGALPLYTLGWKTRHEVLEISMFEGLEFRRGSKNIPDTLQLIIQSEEKMQFYSSTVKVHAKFQGLRWLLYNYKIGSFVAFTAAFYGVAVASMLLVYLVFSFNRVGQQSDTKSRIKMESKEMELIKAQDPATAGSASDVTIKKEDFDSLEPSDIAPLGGEADDEDEEDEIYDGNTSGWRDSGIGTGREDRGDANRKRKSYVSR